MTDPHSYLSELLKSHPVSEPLRLAMPTAVQTASPSAAPSAGGSSLLKVRRAKPGPKPGSRAGPRPERSLLRPQTTLSGRPRLKPGPKPKKTSKENLELDHAMEVTSLKYVRTVKGKHEVKRPHRIAARYQELPEGVVQSNMIQFINTQNSSEEDEVLDTLENEAKQCFISKAHSLNFDKMKRVRRYVDNNLSVSSEDEVEQGESTQDSSFNEEVVKEILKIHLKRKKQRRKMRVAPEFKENWREISKAQAESLEDSVECSKHTSNTKIPQELGDGDDSSNLVIVDDDSLEGTEITKFSADRKTSSSNRHGKKKRDYLRQIEGKSLTVEQLNIKRKRVWISLAKKEISKAHKSRQVNQKEKMANSKKTAASCMRIVRQKAMQSQKLARDTLWRAKRLTREMQAYWKKFDRVEKQQKRQQEKEAEEQQKMDVQLLEAKRQQRKLNFLITQTELYAHFIAKKINDKTEGDEQEIRILNQLQEEKSTGRLAEIDEYDSGAAQSLARNNAVQAAELHHIKAEAFEVESASSVNENSVQGEKDRLQPALFCGTLKNYQLKGMNWLMDLYDQGINGILADEMGLGKTIQALSMLAYIAEKYNIWGPFLVITPASTLHNWQQEVERFVPAFKVVPYWGSPQERKILRHFWEQKNLHQRNASFHIVITSYQLVITDFKYFNRIKWQYLILDEAQAIKSSSSQRWKMLLEFKCRNRLLLSGTPIQNSMAELWSLLHFVMPTLFDSHEEFNDWFSKDIESSAESKSQIDEKQISRLHMILKPFMLRRIKKDVENELTDKVEILLYCPLTIRQKLLYMGLKKKIKVEDLLQGLGSQSENSTIASSLMNLVMQFRKVCNHPELFERREARSPFAMSTNPYYLPKLLAHDNFQHYYSTSSSSRKHLLYNRFCIFHPENVHRSLTQTRTIKTSTKPNTEYLEVSDSTFSYLRFIDNSPGEQLEIFFSILALWKKVQDAQRRLGGFANIFHSRRALNIVEVLRNEDLIFTSPVKPITAHLDVTLNSMPETTQHRLIRTKSRKGDISNHCDNAKVTRKLQIPLLKHLDEDHIEEDDDAENLEARLLANLVPKIEYKRRPPVVLRCMPHDMPPFLYNLAPRIATSGRLPYCYDISFAHKLKTHQDCSNCQGKQMILFGSEKLHHEFHHRKQTFSDLKLGGLMSTRPSQGYSNIIIPDKQCLVSDCGKLHVLDNLLARLKSEGHRVLIYSQMTRMIDLLEEYMSHRKHKFIRLDGSSKISERRDMVNDFQQRSDIFVFLLSTRAGGLGINLTAADTVIFYDSDWNPTVDQQAMDRAHRLGQTKQVTVYRLICKGTIEERILQRAREKSEIQRMVIQGGSFKGKSGDLKPKEVVSLLLDDEEIERKYNKAAKQQAQGQGQHNDGKNNRKRRNGNEVGDDCKKFKSEDSIILNVTTIEDSNSIDSINVDFDSGASSREPTRPPSPLLDFLGENIGPKRLMKRGIGGKRGRPRRGGKNDSTSTSSMPQNGVILQPSLAQTVSSPRSRGPGRPRLKPGGTPMNQGSRSKSVNNCN